MRFVLPLCLLFSATAAAADEPPRPRNSGIVNLQVENDVWANGSDRHYTNGIRLSYLTAPRDCATGDTCLGRVLRTAAELVPFFKMGEELRISYSVGQNIYTPDDISVTELIPGERPYAGWLYGGIGFVSKNSYTSRPDREYNRIDNFEINIGVVGPASGGGWIHRNWHDLFDMPEPRGWAHQLRNEPGLVVIYERVWQFKQDMNLVPGLELDFAPSIGAAVGNVFTHGAAGVRLRVGKNLPDGFGPPRIRPSLPGSDYFEPRENKYGLYGFAGVEGRAVARNIFLDGNTFRDSHSVEKKHFVGDLNFGLALVGPRTGFLPPFRLSYSYVIRSREFVGQKHADKFASINLSFNFGL